MLQTLKRAYRNLKRLPDRIMFQKPSSTFVHIGTEYGGWWIETVDLCEDSKILSAGLGEDITFDLGLIKLKGCRILGFDPTPKAVEYIKQINNNKFEFNPYGLAGHNGDILLHKPVKGKASYYVTDSVPEGQMVQFEVLTVATIMSQKGWRHVDLLKLDIEGSEFAVIDHLIEHKIDIRQLCVEFHPKLAQQLGYSIAEYVVKLERELSLMLVYKEAQDYTFLKK